MDKQILQDGTKAFVKHTENNNLNQTVRGNELYSKERPGSIVKETLKNGILMLKDTSKESNFHADFKYISFIKFNLCHQKLQA